MTEDDRKDIEIYLKILDYSHKRHDWRANIEWKLTFAVWTVISAATAFFITQKILIPYWASTMLSFPFFIFHWFWLHGIYKGHTQWKRRMDFWADKAQMTALGGSGIEFMGIRMIDPSKSHSSAFWGQGKYVYLLVTLGMCGSFIGGPKWFVEKSGPLPAASSTLVLKPQQTLTEPTVDEAVRQAENH